MKKCEKCGLENSDDSIFCAGCGATLEAAAAPQQPIQPETPAAAYAYSAPAAPAPAEKNIATLWLILNIVLTVLCCGNLLGIIGIIFAAMGMGSFNKGNYEDMKAKTKTAKILFIVGIVLGVIGLILLIALGVVGQVMSNYGY